jgi:uncharacterized Zn-binding protein involved in type VI secretion
MPHYFGGAQLSWGRMACRIGDGDFFHCSSPHRMTGSLNVLVNGLPWSCQGDINAPHLIPCKCPICCCIHVAPITFGSWTVRVNGRGAGRTFDSLSACTAVMTGSWNVIAGG